MELNASEEDEAILAPPKEPCQMCNSNDFKYKCPKCLTKTCSLQCSKDHKVKYNCDGVKPHIS